MGQSFTYYIAAAAFLIFLQPHGAWSQDASSASSSSSLPWKNGSSAPIKHHSSGKHHTNNAAPHTDSQRNIDDRKLNTLADEYYHITAKSKQPVEKLDTLLKRAKAFRKTLENRNYAASDLIHDTVSLEHRIAAKKKKLEADLAAKNGATPAAIPPLPQH